MSILIVLVAESLKGGFLSLNNGRNSFRIRQMALLSRPNVWKLMYNKYARIFGLNIDFHKTRIFPGGK